VRELYRVLEVEPTADFETIRESYRRLLKRYHPDSGGSGANEAKLDAVVDAFRRISTLRGAHRSRPRRRAGAAGRTDARGSGRARADARATTGRARAHTRAATGRAGAGTGGPDAAGDTPDVFGLGKMLLESPVARTRAFAARRLGSAGRRSAYAYLKKGLADPNEHVVVACVRAIGKLGVLQAAPDFSTLFHTGSEVIRRTIMEAAAEIRRPEVFRNLILVGLEDEDARVRRLALRLFVELER